MARIKNSPEYLEEAQCCLARAKHEMADAKRIMVEAFTTMASEILRTYKFARTFQQRGNVFEFSFQFGNHVLDVHSRLQLADAISTSKKRRRYTENELASLDALQYWIADYQRHCENYRQLFGERRLPNILLTRDEVL